MKSPVNIVDANLFAAYRQMSEDRTREAQAQEWIEGLIEDALPQPD